MISSCAVPCHMGFYALGKTESAAEAAFALPGGLVVPSMEIITFQAVGIMQAASQNCTNKNSKRDGCCCLTDVRAQPGARVAARVSP